MSSIEPHLNRSVFIPRPKSAQIKQGALKLKRNSAERKQAIEASTKNDVKVDIANRVKDFARIKSAVIQAPNVDHSEKIAVLKKQIASGQYEINYDALADKLLQSEF